jgi:site-specific DNA-methyltransferase (adenine-specific)
MKGYKKKEWDNAIPTKEYFDELFRVSKNQIIWGGNYFIEHLKNTRCFISWDKMNGTNNMADFELAWTSFESSCRRFSMHHFSSGNDKKIHPTQKPTKLYKWILDKYAKEGDKILDTHLGSGSIAIACHYAGHQLDACELDEEYFNQAMERVTNQTRQTTLL